MGPISIVSWCAIAGLMMLMQLGDLCEALPRFDAQSTESYGSGDSNSNSWEEEQRQPVAAAAAVSGPYDYEEYAFTDSEFYNYPDFGLKHTKQTNSIVPKVSVRPRLTTTPKPTTTRRPTTSTTPPTSTSTTSTTTTTTSTSPAPVPQTTRRLYKYTRHRITTPTTTTTTPAPAPTPPPHRVQLDDEDTGSYEIEEYDIVEIKPLPSSTTPSTTSTSTRRPFRRLHTTRSTTTKRSTEAVQSTSHSPRHRGKPLIANSSSNRNEIRIRPQRNRTLNAAFVQHVQSGLYDGNIEELEDLIRPDNSDENDSLIESASQTTSTYKARPSYASDHGYNPLQEYEYSIQTKHPVAEQPKKQVHSVPSNYDRSSYDADTHSHRQLFSTDLYAHKYSDPDNNFGFFKPIANPAQASNLHAAHFAAPSGPQEGFQPVHIDFASDLNVADLPLESFPSRLHQFSKKPVKSVTQHHQHIHHHHTHSQNKKPSVAHQHPVKLPSYYSESSSSPRDQLPHSVFVSVETEPFIPSEPILTSAKAPYGSGGGGGGGRLEVFNPAIHSAVASPEQIAVYNKDQYENYERLIEKQLRNSKNPSDRAKYHQFLKAKEDERHEMQQAKRQQQTGNRFRPTAQTHKVDKPQFRPKRPYTTPGLRHFRKPSPVHQHQHQHQPQTYAADRSYEFPFV